MNDQKTNEIHRVPKNQADAFFVLAFQAVDLASTEHCGNNHHLLLLRAPKNWIDVRPSAEIPKQAVSN